MPNPNYTLTFSQLQSCVKHALGKTPDAQLTSAGQIVNEALQILVGASVWTWRLKYDLLDTVAGSNSLGSVPTDFLGVHTMHNKTVDGQNYSMLDEILPIRPGTPQNAHSTYRYHVDIAAQANASTEPTRTILIFPAAALTTTGGIEMIYVRSIPELVGLGDLPDIPASYSTMLKQIVRAYALIQDHQPAGKDEWEIYLEMLKSFINEDTALRSNYAAGLTKAGDGSRATQ